MNRHKSDSVSLVFEKWQVFQVHLITYKYTHINGAKQFTVELTEMTKMDLSLIQPWILEKVH